MLQSGLDPNWFYSTLAQSSAGVVGLLGGVLATRLGAQIADARQPRREFTRSVKDYVYGAESVIKGVDPYIQHSEPQLRELEAALRDGHTTREFREFWFLTSKATGGVRLTVNEVEVGTFRDDTRDAPKLHDWLQRATQVSTYRHFVGLQQEIAQGLNDMGARGRGVALEIVNQGKNVLDKARRLEDATSPKAAIAGLVVLLFLCGSGLLGPLLWLTAAPGASKPRLYFFFALGLLGLLGFICYQIIELLRLRDRKDLKRAFNELD